MDFLFNFYSVFIIIASILYTYLFFSDKFKFRRIYILIYLVLLIINLQLMIKQY